MKNFSIALASGFLAFNVSATGPREVLSMQSISVGGNEISLPKTMMSDGTVCQSFLAESWHEDGEVIVRIAQICDVPVTVQSWPAGFGRPEIYPARLRGMNLQQHGDLAAHSLDLNN